MIKEHMLIRSGALAGITKADQDRLIKEYHLKTVIDFRTETERQEKPDPSWRGWNIFPIPFSGSSW